MAKWRCLDCDAEYADDPGPTCPTCNGFTEMVEASSAASGEVDTEVYAGDCGLAVFVFDLSGSMTTPMAGTGGRVSKIDVVARAFSEPIATLNHGTPTGGDAALTHADRYYVAVVGFAGQAELLGVWSLAQMAKADWEATRKHWLEYLLAQMGRAGGATNVSAGLEIARCLVDEALGRRARSLLPDDFRLASQSMLWFRGDDSQPIEVPNVRVLIYSDGEHNVGPFCNAFESFELFPGSANAEGRLVNGILSLYFAEESEVTTLSQSPGALLMRAIAGYCPQHGGIGFMPMIEIKQYPLLRGIFHQTSRASGCCVRCAL